MHTEQHKWVIDKTSQQNFSYEARKETEKLFNCFRQKKRKRKKSPKDLWKGSKLSSFKLIHITQINKLIHANRMACVSGVSWQWLFMGISDSPTIPIFHDVWILRALKLSINLAQRVNEGPKSMVKRMKIYCLSSIFSFSFPFDLK